MGISLVEPFIDMNVNDFVNPLCFRDIVNALIVTEEKTTNINRSFATRRGKLGMVQSNPAWNMFYGRDLLEAVDLVLLNGLVYYGREKSHLRLPITKLRKNLWDNIYWKMGPTPDRSNTPTKRGIQSGFIVKKKKGTSGR